MGWGDDGADSYCDEEHLLSPEEYLEMMQFIEDACKEEDRRAEAEVGLVCCCCCCVADSRENLRGGCRNARPRGQCLLLCSTGARNACPIRRIDRMFNFPRLIFGRKPY